MMIIATVEGVLLSSPDIPPFYHYILVVMKVEKVLTQFEVYQ